MFAAIVALMVLAQPVDHQRADLLSAYASVRAELDSRYADPIRSGRSHDFPRTLNRAWRIAGDWTALYLNQHPSASPREVVDAIHQLNHGGSDEYRLRAEAVPLRDRAAWAISASYLHGGTFFVVARDRGGPFAVRWNIKDVAARHYASRDEIGNWASYGFGWGDGPLTGSVGQLISNRNGRPRFYVDAHAAAAAGGTIRQQISVWEWDGHNASPLFIRSYATSLETAPDTFSDRLITIHAKGDYQSFSTCGTCLEPEVVWQIRATPDAVTHTPPEYVDKELKACDSLWDAVIHHRPTQNIASPKVIALLRKLTASMIASSPDHDRIHLLGMLMTHDITHSKTRTILALSADNLPCSSIRFEIEERRGILYFADVHAPHCE
ncbi:MAG TPA: hypothetical protein VGQ65_25680 [Thermoanaerobaculia bacterium]|jgi:hypothetical protein|nr:hypothetical protein [Thermoanaerobaculia bacterium]